jgi:hypothetical protein
MSRRATVGALADAETAGMVIDELIGQVGVWWVESGALARLGAP